MTKTVTSTALDADTATIGELIAWLKDSPFPHDQKAATEIERLQAENAKLKMHAEAMADDLEALSIQFDDDAPIATKSVMDYRADFPKEPSDDK